MRLQRFFCEGLAQAGYVLADGDEAIVVDPLRDAEPVLAFLAAQRLRARWVIATHVHADFVGGLHEVAAVTGAPMALGDHFTGGFPCERLGDGQVLRLGDGAVTVLATPGHTKESICLLARGHEDTAGRLLTGDTLFVGDVGRPDLAHGAGDSAAAMAAMLFASLHQRLAPLPDDTEIWPAHGAGSACGSRIASAPSSTLGAERADNWALRGLDQAVFTARLLQRLRPPPPHFATIAQTNCAGPALRASLATPTFLSEAQVLQATAHGALVLDVRSWLDYGRGHWPQAINLGLDGGEFEPWAGTMLRDTEVLVLHAETAARAHTARVRLLRVGLERVVGFVCTPPADPVRVPQIDAIDLFEPGGGSRWQVLDVRREDEFVAGHIEGAHHVELGRELHVHAIPRDANTAVLCEGGYRSSAAMALLKAAGFTALHNVRDGMRGWRQNHLPEARGSTTATS